MLFEMLRGEVADDRFATTQEHLERLKSRHGILISAQLGKGNKATNYALRLFSLPGKPFLTNVTLPQDTE